MLECDTVRNLCNLCPDKSRIHTFGSCNSKLERSFAHSLSTDVLREKFDTFNIF